MSMNTSNISPDRRIMDNRIKEYNGIHYHYDELGNIIQRDMSDGTYQLYKYDLSDRMIQTDIFTKESGEWQKETWQYQYDAFGRRTLKGRLNPETGTLENITEFLWDGSHLFQEIIANGIYTYIYEEPDSYVPLAQVFNYTDEECASHEQISYFHCDQAGSPREMTDPQGRLLWYGTYMGFGQLREETNITGVHQPFRLQNQYCDFETGLHYNFFRYYDAGTGRFISQDPIGLEGGSNAYFAFPNAQMWYDPLGLTGTYFMKNAKGNCYAGKGPLSRMHRSTGRFKQPQVGDVVIDPRTMKPTICVHRDFTNSPYPNKANEIGLMVEAELMREFDAVMKTNCYNKINSFGAKLLNDEGKLALSEAQRKKYGITKAHRDYALKQAAEMIADIRAGKCSHGTKCPE